MHDIYDINRKKTGRQFIRGEKLAKGEFQLAASVAIINKEGQCLITRRHPSKEMGLFWELPGGAVEINESSEGAGKREILEEIGLQLTQRIELVGTTCYEELNLLTDVFIVMADVTLESLKLQADEVVEAMFCTSQSVTSLYVKGELTPFDWEAYKSVRHYLAKKLL